MWKEKKSIPNKYWNILPGFRFDREVVKKVEENSVFFFANSKLKQVIFLNALLISELLLHWFFKYLYILGGRRVLKLNRDSVNIMKIMFWLPTLTICCRIFLQYKDWLMLSQGLNIEILDVGIFELLLSREVSWFHNRPSVWW